jgi:hypothetical protein
MSSGAYLDGAGYEAIVTAVIGRAGLAAPVEVMNSLRQFA